MSAARKKRSKQPEAEPPHGAEPAHGPAPPHSSAQPLAGLPHHVTQLTPIETQVGLHVIGALQHPHTVAVITTVALGGDGQQRIISIGLDEQLLDHVQRLIHEADTSRAERVPCIGFHCAVHDPADEDEQS